MSLIESALPPPATCKRNMPPPPMPELCGSTTDSTAATATAASNALPPCESASKPASVASLCALAIAACPGFAAASTCCGLAACAPAATTSSAKEKVYKIRLDIIRLRLVRRICGQHAVFFQQGFARLHVLRVDDDAFDRTHLNALRRVV